MIDFLGEYEATLDTKGRFLLPAGFKKQLREGESAQFVVARGFESCLSLYPMENWKFIIADVAKLSSYNAKNREFIRRFMNGATIVELDSAGRMLLPPALKEYAGLGKDIVLASAIDKIEIWDKTKHQQFFDSFPLDDFSKLAEEVMEARKKNETANG